MPYPEGPYTTHTTTTGSYPTPTYVDITPEDLEAWYQQGRPVRVEERRRFRSPSGRMRDETSVRMESGGLDDLALESMPGPMFGGGIPPVPEMYPASYRRPNFIIIDDGGVGPSGGGGYYPDGGGYGGWRRRGPLGGGPYGGGCGRDRDIDWDDIAMRVRAREMKEHIAKREMEERAFRSLFPERFTPFTGERRRFGGGYAHTFVPDGGSPSSSASRGPYRGGRSPTPGFVFAEDDEILSDIFSGAGDGPFAAGGLGRDGSVEGVWSYPASNSSASGGAGRGRLLGIECWPSS
jgi:hypothetical protein